MELDSVLIRDHSMQKAKFLPRKNQSLPFSKIADCAAVPGNLETSSF